MEYNFVTNLHVDTAIIVQNVEVDTEPLHVWEGAPIGARPMAARVSITPVKAEALNKALEGYHSEKRKFLYEGFSQGF